MAVESPEISISNVQATSSHDRHTKPLNFTEPNTVSSIDAHNVLPVNRGGRNTTATSSDLRHSGTYTSSIFTLWTLVSKLHYCYMFTQLKD